MKMILTIFLAFILLGCGECKMATIGEEVQRSMTASNVTDATPYYDTTSITLSSFGDSAFIIKNDVLFGTGANDSGQLGLGTTTSVSSFTTTGVTNVKSVSSGANHTFIIKNDGTLWAAGSNGDGQLGRGKKVGYTLTFEPVGIDNVKNVYCGINNTFIIKNDGTLWATGLNDNGQLGLGHKNNIYTFEYTGQSEVVKVGTAAYSTAIIKGSGNLFATGVGLGVGLPSDVTSFTDTTESNVSDLSCGYYFTYIIKNSVLYASGKNNFGQLGVGDLVDKPTFVTTGVTNIADFVAGAYHGALVTSSGALYVVGLNGNGQIGLGATTYVNVFTSTGLTSMSKVECGLLATYALKTDFTLWDTGANNLGQLGLGDTTERNVFTNTSQVVDTFVSENWSYFFNLDEVRIGDFRYLFNLIGTSTPSIFGTLTYIGTTNTYKPFDDTNSNRAIFASPMTYTATAAEEFNAFTLAKVLATGLTYTFKNSVGATIKTETVAIDCKRDKDGILSLYPTTVVFYAGQQIEAGGYVEISLTRASGNVELGSFTLNNAIELGDTNLEFTHGVKDYNSYIPDAFGNIPESTKAIVTEFNISLGIQTTNYDYAVSFNESMSGKNVTIDASDSNGVAPNGIDIFGSLTRRVRLSNIQAGSIVKDGAIYKMSKCSMTATEIV